MSSRSKKRRDRGPNRPRPDVRGPSGGPSGAAGVAGPPRDVVPASPPSGPRRRGRTALVLLVIAAFISLSGWLLLVRVTPGSRVFRISAGGSKATPLAPGWHASIPIATRVIRLPAGRIEIKGEVPLRSREGVPLTVLYETSAEIDDRSLAALLETRDGRAGPEPVLRALSAAGIASWGESVSGQDLILRQGVAGTEASVRKTIEGRGFDLASVRIVRVEGPPEVLASVQGRALRDRTIDTGTKIAILGLDGADWEIIDPLIDKGELPNLARLRARGAWGNLKSMFPMLSPLLWTSIATGKPADRHGIIDFLVKDKKTGEAVPVSSRWRKVKALWNIFSDAGRSSAFVAWWATWPAETVDGYMVSDRVAYSLFGYESSSGDHAGATYPPDYYQTIRSKIVDDASIPLREVQQFVSITPAEFAELRARILKDPKSAYRLPVNHLTKILASEASYQAIGLDILSRGQPGLFSIYYQGIDEVCHRFAHDMPPKMDMVTQEDYDKYHDAVFAYYRHQDRLLGEVLARLAPDTSVIVLSDHGFRNGSDRPPRDPPYIEGKPGLWHRRYGIFIAAGPAFRRAHLDTTSLLDVAPTVLYIAGLPVAEDMEGRVIREAIDARFLGRVSVRTIPSYEGIGRPLETGRDLVADGQVDQEMKEKLRSLGYIGPEAAGESSAQTGPLEGPGGPSAGRSAAGGGDEDQELVTGYLNEAGLSVKAKEWDKAAASVAQALEVKPGYLPAQLLSVQVDAERKRYPQAIETARGILEKNPESEPALYILFGKVFAESGRAAEGLADLTRRAAQHPQIAEIHSALGSLHLKQGETSLAEKEFLEALRLNPALSEPLTELHTLYENSERVLSLEPLVRKGLSINEKSVVHHNWMGFIYEWRKQIPEAEREFKRAIELDPDDPATLANIGALYGRAGRLEEAVAVLNRAVAKEPDNKEAWVNLGAAQGRLRHARQAIEALETARRKGVRSTTLFNALALAYLQDHQREKALEYLRESLEMDPNQKDARDLLKAVSRSS